MSTHPNLLATVAALEWAARQRQEFWQPISYTNRHGVRGMCARFWHGPVYHMVSVHNCATTLKPLDLAYLVSGIELIDESRFGIYANKNDTPGFYATAKSTRLLDWSNDHWFMISRTPEMNFAEILENKRTLSEEEQDLLPYLENAGNNENRQTAKLFPNQLRAEKLAIRQSEMRSRQQMKRSIPSQKAAERKFRSKFFRNEAEQNIVDQIASFFDERKKAFSLLKKNIYNGLIETPVKIMSIQEFLKIQQEAWTERKRLHIPHSIHFLRDSILADKQTSANYPRRRDFDPYAADLDSIEGDREKWLNSLIKGDQSQYYEEE